MTTSEGVAVLITLVHDLFQCGCQARGRLCARCVCVEEIARALCASCFTRDEWRVLYAALTEGTPPQEDTP
jgi:hypothetical protein